MRSATRASPALPLAGARTAAAGARRGAVIVARRGVCKRAESLDALTRGLCSSGGGNGRQQRRQQQLSIISALYSKHQQHLSRTQQPGMCRQAP